MSGKSVTFTFDSSASPAARQDALDRIRHWEGVISAQLLKPDARNPDVARMAYVLLADDADADAVAEQLARMDAIESASVPARRFIVRGR